MRTHRTLRTEAGDRIEWRVTGSGRGQDVEATLVLHTRLPEPIRLRLTPTETTRLEELVHDFEGDAWGAEYGECHEHEITLKQCRSCLRYEMERGKCPHAAEHQ